MTEIVITKPEDQTVEPSVEESMPWLSDRVYQLKCMMEATLAMSRDNRRREFFNEMLLESHEMATSLDKDIQNALLNNGVRKAAH